MKGMNLFQMIIRNKYYAIYDVECLPYSLVTEIIFVNCKASSGGC
jgi:hypothetical protein